MLLNLKNLPCIMSYALPQKSKHTKMPFMLLKVFITTKINQDKKDIENSKTLILYKIFKKQKEKNPQHFFD